MSGLRNTIITGVFTLLGLLLAANISLAGSVSAGVKKGNRLYQQGNYDQALKYYNEAQTGRPDSAIVSFNTGTALYQKGDYQKAVEAFTKALINEDRKLEAKAAYNIGNSKYRIGKLKVNTDLSSAAGLLRETLDYYKRAIELNRENRDAKYNHEFVEKELKILLDKMKQQEKQEQDSKNGKQEEQQKQKQSQSSSSSQQEEEQKQSRTQPEAKQQEKTRREKDEKKEGQAEQPAVKKQEEIAEEEARMLLKRYGQEEVSPQEINRKSGQGYYPPVLKDW